MTRTPPHAATGAPDQPSHQTSFWLIAVAFLITMVGTTLPTPLYALYQQHLGFGATWVTLIFAIYAAGVISALLAVGSWSDQLGRRPMLLAGLAMGAISAVIFLCTDSIGGLLIARLISGFSAGIMTGTGTVAVIEAAPKRWRNSATLVATAANMLGLGLGPLLAGFTSQFLPWPVHLAFVVHLVLLLAATAAILAVGETVQRPAKPRLGFQRPSLPAAVRGPFVPAAIAGLAGFSVTGLFTSLVPAIMRQVMGHAGGLVIGAVILVLFAGSIVGQAWVRRIREAAQMTVGCTVLILGVACLGLSIASAQLWLLVLGGALSGIGQGLTFRAGMGAVANAAPVGQKAGVTSALFIVYYLSMSVPVIAVGVSIPVFGLHHSAEFFSAVVALIAVLAMLSMNIVRARASNA
ncbi:MFS transporter [Pseudomonas coleopterorum]|uniref:MFS transporter n=1 Tax=Pseudomonas coleopterorum TaxID=1605838 RepID=UPI000894AF86|nr:MFS transporter [Pseudomonas coleopterorum]SEE11575.1 Predicted arabinose efflux permease, MFS family [Pseudomonas coleopterorum]